MSVQFPFPVLVCDVGGTNARFAVKHAPDAELAKLKPRETHAFPSLTDATRSAFDEHTEKPRSMIVCGAGPVSGKSLKLTNANWHIDGPAAAKALDLDQGLLLNDFEAQALSLPSIPEDWVKQIGSRAPDATGTRLILGPGTGLGISALLEADGKFVPVPSEAGHIEFGPTDPTEASFWPHLERVHGRVTSESVMAGPGLSRIHRARLAVSGQRPAATDNAGIVDHALANPKSEEGKTIAILWRLIARFAGDMALVFKASGGVTLAGGILPRVVDLLNENAFREAFERKAPLDTLAREISTRLVVHADAVLVGMAAIATEPERYSIDYKGRCWR